MARQIKNYHRFYASFNKLPKRGDDEDTKAAIVSQWTGGRTTHLGEMRAREYNDCCKALESMLGYGDQRKLHRSICLHLMQEIGIDTKDWQRINDFCRHPRISGKEFALLGIAELQVLALKLRAIKRKGGLESEERRVKSNESEERRVKSEELREEANHKVQSSNLKVQSKQSTNIIILQDYGTDHDQDTAGRAPRHSN